MIKLEKTQVTGLEPAIRGMRNPMNSWEKSDSVFDVEMVFDSFGDFTGFDGHRITGVEEYDMPREQLEMHKAFQDMYLGPNDLDLMKRLAKNGPVHAKYRRMIVVYVDITAPLYWWKEMETYKIGTVSNSCSTMHKIQAKEFTLEDFSCEHLIKAEDIDDEKEFFVSIDVDGEYCLYSPKGLLIMTCQVLNAYRKKFLETKDKKYWWQMIQLLPSSYNQKRTVMLNYEVLAGIYPMRKDHKLDCWIDFCKWIESLPYSELITLKKVENECNLERY